MEDELMQSLSEVFPCPLLARVSSLCRLGLLSPRCLPSNLVAQPWLERTTKEYRDGGGPSADDAFDVVLDMVSKKALNTPLAVCTEEGTGFEANLSFSTMCDAIQGPMVLELKHLTDIGVSAFQLEKVRYSRDRSFHAKLFALAAEGEVATPEDLQEIRKKLPQYPRKCLKLTLSDGVRELEAIELEPLDVQLGVTPMGTKVSFSTYWGVQGLTDVLSSVDTDRRVRSHQGRCPPSTGERRRARREGRCVRNTSPVQTCRRVEFSDAARARDGPGICHRPHQLKRMILLRLSSRQRGCLSKRSLPNTKSLQRSGSAPRDTVLPYLTHEFRLISVSNKP